MTVPIFDPLFTDGSEVFDNISPMLGAGIWPGTYQELEYRDGGSPTESFDLEKGGRASRVLKVDWDTRQISVADIMGYVEPYVPGSGVFKRHLPAQYPYYPWLIAQRIPRIKGHGPWGGQPIGGPGLVASFTEFNFGHRMLRYKFAELTVEYEAVDYAIRSDQEIITSSGTPRKTGEWKRYVSINVKPQADYLSVPGGAWLWAEGGGHNVAAPSSSQSFPGPIGKILPTADIEMIWRRVPFNALPLDDITKCLGRVNDTWFFTLPAHTVLFLSATIERHKGPIGMWEWDVKYTFKYRPTGHNKFFFYQMNNKQGWFQISIDGKPKTPGLPVFDGELPFDEFEFYKLFTGV